MTHGMYLLNLQQMKVSSQPLAVAESHLTGYCTMLFCSDFSPQDPDTARLQLCCALQMMLRHVTITIAHTSCYLCYRASV